MRKTDRLTDRDAAVLRLYAAHSEPMALRMIRVAEALSVNRSSVLHHVTWLAKAGFLQESEDGRGLYRITPKGRAAARNVAPVTTKARRVIRCACGRRLPVPASAARN